jgi:hypothetical protein
MGTKIEEVHSEELDTATKVAIIRLNIEANANRIIEAYPEISKNVDLYLSNIKLFGLWVHSELEKKTATERQLFIHNLFEVIAQKMELCRLPNYPNVWESLNMLGCKAEEIYKSFTEQETEKTEQPKPKEKAKRGRPKSPEPDMSELKKCSFSSHDKNYIEKMYQALRKTKSISEEISFEEYFDMVNRADFRQAETGGIRSNILKSISLIKANTETPKGWYLSAAHSLNTEPTRCSGANPTCEFEEEIKQLKRNKCNK